jgi:serine protease
MLRGYAAYSGVTLQGSYSTGSTCTNTSEVEPNNSRTAPQAISGTCNQIAGTFLNDATSQQNDYYRLSLPAGRTATALLNGLSVDYDLYIYNSTSGSAVAQSTAGGTTADQASWTNTGASAVNVYVRVHRYSSTRTTYALRVSY